MPEAMKSVKRTTSGSSDRPIRLGALTIRSRLIECYRNLYFDPLPDMDAKQQVNRITKNMIESVLVSSMKDIYLTNDPRLTYDATLAELTSVEELMRTMMEDNQIHADVIAKLWQVYSRRIPSFCETAHLDAMEQVQISHFRRPNVVAL